MNRSVSAVCPGIFDPIHMGHLDVVRRAAGLFGHVVVAVLENPRKSSALFTVEERIALIEETVNDLDNVTVDRFQGLLVDYCRQHGHSVIVKGLRAVSDFEYELQMALMNQAIGEVETLFMSTRPEYSYLSSSLVKEVAQYGGPTDGTVPPPVEQALRNKLQGAGG
jgi:pantetheine-phosphate adenylyltransferase